MSLARPVATSLASCAAHGAQRVALQGTNVAVKAHSRRPVAVRAAGGNGDAKERKSYKVTVLPGDGIGPEIIGVAVDVLRLVGSQEGEWWGFGRNFGFVFEFGCIVGSIHGNFVCLMVGGATFMCSVQL